MDRLHLCLVGIHISLVGGLIMIESHLSSVDVPAFPYVMIVGGLALPLGTLLGYLWERIDVTIPTNDHDP